MSRGGDTLMSSVLTPDDGRWPAEGEDSLLVLALARTPVERAVIDEMLADLRGQIRSGDVVVTEDVEEALRIAERDDVAITPVGVAWLPAPRRSGRVGLADLAALGDPARPRAGAQARIRARAPERCRVVVGEPAGRADLLARWEHHTGRAGAGDGFGAFVLRHARLTLDRAERTLLGSRHKTARDIVEDLLESRRFRAGAESLAAELGRSTADVVARAREDLTELASVQNPLARDVWVRMARFLWGRAYEAEVDEAGLQRLRALNRRHPLVFLPSHKSNLDGFVMASVIYDAGFPQNHVIGGENMGFWPLGALGRRVGVVWIRRSFGDDAIYKFALRRYLAHLAAKRFNLEWYIEGGRSRSGKLLPPRMGLLHYLAQGVEEAEVEDVMLIPVSIVYDRLHEVSEMTAESRGAAKRPEGLRWLLGYARKQSTALGRVQVNFGEPLAMRAELATPDGQADRSLALSKLAFEVCTRINRTTPVTPISMMTLALLGVDGWAITAAQAQQAVDPLVGYAERRGLPGSESLAPLHGIEGVLRVLGTLVEHGVVDEYRGSETVYRISPDRELVAAFYRNVVIHWFVNRSIVELALVSAAESTESDPMAVALEEALRLRDLLKFEFFFADKHEFEAELRAEMALIDPTWRAHDGEGLQHLGPALAATGALMADRVLRSFIEAYCVVADRLVARGGASAREADLVEQCLRVGRQYQLQRRIVSAESVSSELFRNGVRLAANRHLLEGDPATLAAGRSALLDELRDVLRRLEILVGSDHQRGIPRESELGPAGRSTTAARR